MKYFYFLFGLLWLTTTQSSLAQSDFYDVSTIQDIRITFADTNWRYMLDSLRFNGEELLEGRVSVNGEELKGVGVRYRDGRSFTPGGSRNGLVVRVDAFNEGQRFHGQQSIDLSSALRDPSMVREVLGYEIARDYFHAPRANYARVSINDEFYGLFVNVEPIEMPFLSRAFGYSEGLLYFADPEHTSTGSMGCRDNVHGSLQYEEDKDCLAQYFDQLQGDAFGPLHNLTWVLAEDPSGLADVIDVDATLWWMAFNNVMANLNSYAGQYANNYYLYQTEDGLFHPIPAGLNLAFGSYKNTGVGSDLHTPQMLMIDPLLHSDNESRPLIRLLLSDPTLQKIYLSHYRTLLAEQLLSGRLENRARALQGMIRPILVDDTNRYYTMEEFDKSLTDVIGERSRIPGLVDFMTKRGNWLETQPVYTLLPPSITEVAVERRQRLSSQRLDEFRIHAHVGDFPKQVYLYYRYAADQPFETMAMLDDGEHYDGTAGDEVYGVVIKPGPGQTAIEYYIMAENVKTVSYSPSRYTFVRHQTSLTEINR
ncbi:MAG: CotH kinase family protein [Lewinella sp.]|nr:CotH kinase family protein [Lewinella sp.]